MGTLEGWTSLVTGASSGIGRAIAVRFAREGSKVGIVGRSATRLKETQRGLGEDPSHRSFVADLSREEDILRVSREVRAWTDSLDVLVHSAGVGYDGTVEETSTKVWDETMAVNVKAPFLLTRELLPLFSTPRPRPRSILMISSVAGLDGRPGLAAYSASKFALRGLSLSLAGEVSSRGIRVTSIQPGYVRTPMVEGVPIPPEKMIDPEELAEVCLSVVTLPPSVLVDELTIWPSKLYDT